MAAESLLVGFVPGLILLAGAAALIVVRRYLSPVVHARIWAGSFLVMAAHWAMVAAPVLADEGVRQASARAGGLELVGAFLLALGFRQRAGRGIGHLAPVGAILLLVAIVPLLALRLSGGPTVALVSACCTGLSLWAAWEVVPGNRGRSVVEGGTMLTLLALAAFHLTRAVNALAGPTLPFFGMAGPLLLAVTPLHAALVLFALLLVAFDFSVELRRLVHTDPLTGVLNRSGFEHAARMAIRRSSLPRRPLSLAIADIDRFKMINDRHGHAVGDATLACVAGHFAHSINQRDIVARLGGEEFVLLFPETDGIAALGRIDPIRHRLTEVCSAEVNNNTVTASFGIAERQPNESLSALLERADRALYQSKHAGRNRSTLADAAFPRAMAP